MLKSSCVATGSLALLLALSSLASAAEVGKKLAVNVDNFARVETDMQIGRMLKTAGGVNKWAHFRTPTPLDKQNVIRMNRDTLYSFAVVDISKGAIVTLPDTGKRYMSMMVVNNDGYINKVFYRGGSHRLTMKEFATPYIVLAVRLLADASNHEDIRAANALQDKMKIEAASATPFVPPDYDMASYNDTYKPLLELSKGLPDSRKTFGPKGRVDPVRFLLGSAFGWGGLPEDEAFYLNVNPGLPVGEYQVTVKDVPVDGFWSISVYNKDGYFQENKFNAYNVNSVSGAPSKDGSFTVNLGGCESRRPNCIPLTEGWNYAVRLYRPRPEVLNGSWKFPSVEAVKK